MPVNVSPVGISVGIKLIFYHRLGRERFLHKTGQHHPSDTGTYCSSDSAFIRCVLRWCLNS